MLDVGRLVAETLSVNGARREIWARLPSYVVRAASQMGESTGGSIYVGDQTELPVEHPRLRGSGG